MNGKQIKCMNCDGHGQVRSWSFGVEEPDECTYCGGSGLNWQYPSGTIAKYYSGPFLAGASKAHPNQIHNINERGRK